MSTVEGQLLDRDDFRTGTIVFLLGAGFSAPLGLPIMNTFIRYAASRAADPANPLQSAYLRVLDFRRECLGISYLLAGRSWDNLEELFTQAHLRSFTEPAVGQQICNRFARVIWDVYRKPLNHDNCTSWGYSHFRMFLSDLIKKWATERTARPIIITTNYDLSLETLLLCAAKHPKDYMRIVYSGEFECDCDNSDFLLFHLCRDLGEDPLPLEIIKLHGSVNWFLSTEGKPSCCTKYEPGYERGSNAVQTLAVQHSGFTERIARDDGPIPLIEPPMLGKAAGTQVIARQWQRAVEALKNAQALAIVGYSFPSTDMFMSKLLAEGLRQNSRMRVIEIVNSAEHSSRFWTDMRNQFAEPWRSTTLVEAPGDFRRTAEDWYMHQPNISLLR